MEDSAKVWDLANSAAQKAQAVLEERQATVPSELQDIQAVEKALQAAQALQSRLNSDWENAQKNKQQ